MKITNEKLQKILNGPSEFKFKELFRLKFRKRDIIFGYVKEQNVVEELAKEVGRIGKGVVIPDHRKEVLDVKVLFNPMDIPEAAKERQLVDEFRQTLRNINERKCDGDPDYFTGDE